MRQTNRQSGFTIIELTLATAVFSVILLVIAAGILSFTKGYLKGVHQSQTQETTRLVMDELTQALQFSATYDEGADGVWAARCFGSVKYSYRTGVRFTGDSSTHALIRSPSATGDCEPTESVTPGTDTELLGKNMRLQALSVTPLTSNTYQIDLRIIYGEDDLINGDRCVSGAGSQFCAAAHLQTTVQRRL